MWTFFTRFDGLCLWYNYVWVQGVAGSFKRLSGTESFLVKFWGFSGKKWAVLGFFFVKARGFFWVRFGVLLVKKNGGFLVRFGGVFGNKMGGG